MASASRQSKGPRKGQPDPAAARRTPAWGSNARASPTFSASGAPPRQQPAAAAPAPAPAPAPATQGTFTPPAQTNGTRTDTSRDRVLQSLSGLTGTTITLATKAGQRYEGVIGSTTTEGATAGVTLKDVKEISIPGAPLKDSVFIASTDIDTWSSGPADAKPTNGDTFRTDTDISQKKGPARERELQAWVPSSDAHPSLTGLVGDDDTFGPGSNGTSWDQFVANEALFGVKATYDEDVYTTKIDRSAPDFKERERKAQKLANEILGTTTNNPHIAEERGISVDDSGVNEEDKYGAVVRKQGAYVPPGARKQGPASVLAPVAETASSTGPKADIPKVPKVSVNGPDGAAVTAQGASNSSSKAPSPAPAGAAPKPPADPLPAFRDFVTNEKQRLTQKRQAMVKNDMDKRMADLVKFSQSFKLKKPIPEDLVPILAKDEDKQRQIKEKALADAASPQARAIGPSTPANASRGVAVVGAKVAAKPSAQAQPSAALASSATQKAAAPSSSASKAAESATPSTGKKTTMVIQAIPPFKGPKSKTTANTPSAGPPTVNTNGAAANASRASASPSGGAGPVSPNTAAANRLNVNASSFRPNPKVAASPKVGPASASNSASPKPKTDSAPVPPNPFFGTRHIKKSTPVHVKDDFNPFKHNKVVDASQVSAMWPYSGKRYMQMFPPPQHQPAQQHPAHMAPPVPPPIPPPSYEEDSAAQQAASRGYVYAYPPYGYPPHMMPGMAPPVPPGAYMPGPYMQQMPYPPGMPPPNAMYSPAMGQMPPPQAYMPPPPPGAYPPPPNGAGPRPSMPPTPIPAHAHPYYHQSPQLQHAYPMMMPPPPNLPQHGYDGGPAPPVPMGGHA